jgi:hypothetical protein
LLLAKNLFLLLAGESRAPNLFRLQFRSVPLFLSRFGLRERIGRLLFGPFRLDQSRLERLLRLWLANDAVGTPRLI